MKKLLIFTVDLVDRLFGIREIMRDAKAEKLHPLEGDRAIEWSWIVAHLPEKRGRILDLGCVQSALTGITARLGHQVTAVDLRDIEYEMANVNFLRGDLNSLEFESKSFDIIINCSMIEHVGLAGRYGATEAEDGDLLAMRRLRELLSPGGAMLLTIPIGVDGIFAPYHRIYGAKRLPRLLDGYTVIAEEYWDKGGTDHWRSCTRDHALSVNCSEMYYALGLFVLKAA